MIHELPLQTGSFKVFEGVCGRNLTMVKFNIDFEIEIYTGF